MYNKNNLYIKKMPILQRAWQKIFLISFIFLTLGLNVKAQLVQGTVFDLCTGEPLGGHEIRISDINGWNSYVITTSPDGTYSVNVGGASLSGFYRIKTDGTDQTYIIADGSGVLRNRNFYVLPGIQGSITITTCDILRAPRCGEPLLDNNNRPIFYYDRYEQNLSSNPENAPTIGCDAPWTVIGSRISNVGAYTYRAEIYGGSLFNTLLGTTDWVCDLVRPEINCEGFGIDVKLNVGAILKNLGEGVYKVRLVQSCCESTSTSIFKDGYLRWIPNVVPVNVDFKFTANTVVEQSNGDTEINGQLDQCYTTLPGALLGGISGGIVFNEFSQNNAVEWSNIEIREVDCNFGTLGPIIYSRTWTTISGSQPNPFSFAEVREDPNDPLSAPYFLNPANVAGKCFSLQFSAKNACTTAEQTQYFTIPSNLIFQRPLMNDNILADGTVENIKVYPNPFSNELFITLNENISNEYVSIELWDSQGRQVFFQQADLNLRFIRVDTDQLISGVYIYRIRQGEKIVSGKVIK